MPRTALRRLPLSETLFHAAADGVMLIDRHRTVVAINAAFERMTGWSAKEVVGRKDCFTMLQCQEGDARICEHPEQCPGLAAFTAGEQTPYRELTIITKQGKPLDVSASYAPVFLDGAEPAYTVAIYREMTEQKRLRDRLQQQAITDELTGLYNRRYFSERFAEEVKRANRHTHPLSLILADVDGLKAVNDRHGHLAGDSLLVQIGTSLKAMFRGTDIAARYGGDEFIVLLPETEKKRALAAAEKMERSIQVHWLRSWTTLSCGVAAFPEDGLAPYDLLRRTDLAMYRAKQDKKNRVAGAEAPQAGAPHDSPEEKEDHWLLALL